LNNWAPPPSPVYDLESRELFLAAGVYMDVEDRLFPREPTRLDRMGRTLRLLGAVALGCLSATFSMLVIYIVLTLLFNFQPS
jgi:hypothetical protein